MTGEAITQEYIIREPHLPGELIPRWYTRTYLKLVARERPCGLTFDSKMDGVIKELLDVIQKARGKEAAGSGCIALYNATLHLYDARNKKLPQEAREQHYDIAGSIIWETMRENPQRGTNELLEYALDLWKIWGGC